MNEHVADLMEHCAAHFSIPGIGNLVAAEHDRAFFECQPKTLTYLQQHPQFKDDINKGRGHRVPCDFCGGKGWKSFRDYDFPVVSPRAWVDLDCRLCQRSGSDPNYQIIASFRSKTKKVSLQAIVHATPIGVDTATDPPTTWQRHILELDLDLSGLFAHLGQVARNKIKGDDPLAWIEYGQYAVFYLGVKLPYRFELKK